MEVPTVGQARRAWTCFTVSVQLSWALPANDGVPLF